MKMKFMFTACVLLCFAACGPARGPISTEADATSRALAAIGGASTVRTDKEDQVWESVVTMKNGANVSVKLDAQTGDFISAAAKSGPFDYDLSPVPGVLSYKQAIAKANEQKAGAVVAWELEKKPDHYQWEVYIRDEAGKLWELKFFGENGALKIIEEKPEVD